MKRPEPETVGADFSPMETAPKGDDVDKSYTVEVDNVGCITCAAGTTWVVVDPDGIAGGISYWEKDNAEEMAYALNEAYEKGLRARRETS